MEYLKEEKLRSYNTPRFKDSADKTLIKTASFAKTTIFLSHSHRDKELAEGLKNYLASIGSQLYIDWQDVDMPANTNQATALTIKQRIRNLDFFFLLATNNAVKSRWVPWELGVADGIKQYEKIFIIPVSDNTGRFEGSEYLQVYKKIIFTDSGQFVISNPSTTTGPLVESILR